jgi:hypothetical protein
MTPNIGSSKGIHILLNTEQNISTDHQAWLLDDGKGNFTGAIIPMNAPLETMSQWQATLDTVFAEAVTVDPLANIEGLYAITFYSDPKVSGLLLSRLNPSIKEGYDSVIPHSSLGLLAVTQEPETKAHIVICSLTGVVTSAGKLKPNRTLVSFINFDGSVDRPSLNRGEVLAIRAIGKFLHGRIDEHFEANRG